MTLYQINNWDENFENAKSRTIANQRWCPIPNKQDGLGYRRLMAHKNGAALYGAFVAVVLVCSKQETREGYLTDTGMADGVHYDATDLSLMTGIPDKVFEEMLQVLSDERIGWVGIPEGYRNATERDSGIHIKEGKEGKGKKGRNIDSSEPSDSDTSEPEASVLRIPLTKSQGDFVVTQTMLDGWQEMFPALDVLNRVRYIRQWNIDNPSRRKTRKGIRNHITSWLDRDQNKGVGLRSGGKVTTTPARDTDDALRELAKQPGGEE